MLMKYITLLKGSNLQIYFYDIFYTHSHNAQKHLKRLILQYSTTS